MKHARYILLAILLVFVSIAVTATATVFRYDDVTNVINIDVATEELPKVFVNGVEYAPVGEDAEATSPVIEGIRVVVENSPKGNELNCRKAPGVDAEIHVELVTGATALATDRVTAGGYTWLKLENVVQANGVSVEGFCWSAKGTDTENWLAEQPVG